MHVTLCIPIKNNNSNVVKNLATDINGNILTVKKVLINEKENIYGLSFSGIPVDNIRDLLKQNSWIFNRKSLLWEPNSIAARKNSLTFATAFEKDNEKSHQL